MSTSLEQRRLVEQAKQGNRDAFMTLLRPELAGLHQSAYYLCRDADEARDLAQMTCVRAFVAIGSFKADAPLRPWLQRILRNIFLDRRKSAQARHEVRQDPSPDDAAPLSESPDAQSPLDAMLGQERRAELVEHIRALPPTFQEILVLCDIQGASYNEVCEITQLPLGTVKSRLSRARLLLRERLLSAWELSGAAPRSSKKRGHS